MDDSLNEPSQKNLSILEQTTSSSRRIPGGHGFNFVNYTQQTLEDEMVSDAVVSDRSLLFLNTNYSPQPPLIPQSRSNLQNSTGQGFTFVHNSAALQDPAKTRRIVRSEAMKSFWRKTRIERNVTGDVPSGKSKAEEATNLSMPQTKLTESMSDALVTSYSHSLSHLAPHNLVRFCDLSSAVVQSPSTLLERGEVDPFRTLPYRRETSFVSNMIKYRETPFHFSSYPGVKCPFLLILDMSIVSTSLYPVLAPSKIPGTPSLLLQTRLRYCIENPLVFYAVFWATSLHHDIVNGTPRSNDVERVFFKTEAVRLLRQDLCSSGSQISDSQLLAILLLATHDSFGLQEATPEIFTAPLSSLTWLNVYWRMTISDLHLDALFTAIKIRGGLDTLQLMGLAELCSL